MPAERESTRSPSEHRKNSKPVMEKRRRARINASLCELKSLLLQVMKKEGARHNKMEKADILEMTVKHLRQLQRQQFAAAATTDPTVVTKYQSGFAECAHEVSRYLSSVDGVDVDLKARMLGHLANSVQNVIGSGTSQPTPMMSPTKTQNNITGMTPDDVSPAVVLTSSASLDINNNNNNVVLGVPTPSSSCLPPTQFVLSTGSPPQVISGVHLLPTRLPSGEVALVLPGNVLSNSQVPGYVIPLYSGTTTQSTSINTHNDVTSAAPASLTGSDQPTILPTVMLSPATNPVASPGVSPGPVNLSLEPHQTSYNHNSSKVTSSPLTSAQVTSTQVTQVSMTSTHLTGPVTPTSVTSSNRTLDHVTSHSMISASKTSGRVTPLSEISRSVKPELVVRHPEAEVFGRPAIGQVAERSGHPPGEDQVWRPW